jgi:organic radical activating enzyme
VYQQDSIDKHTYRFALLPRETASNRLWTVQECVFQWKDFDKPCKPIIIVMKTIVCLGSGNNAASDMAENLAKAKDLPYHWVLSNQTKIQTGVYHTSVYDIIVAELVSMLNNTSCEIVILDQTAESFNNFDDFVQFLLYATELESHFDVSYQNSNTRSWILNELRINPSFCIAPFTSIFSADNVASHCCLMKKVPLHNFDFYGPWSQNIRNKMLQGKLLEECKTCWQLEKQGAPSFRQNLTQSCSRKFQISSLQQLKDNSKPLMLFINLDNKCNALCRTCEPAASNLIDKEYKKLDISNLYRSSVTTDPFQFVSPEIRFLSVSGGEPTVNQNFFKFLDKCIESNTTDLSMEISTNASVLSDQMVEYAKKFSNMKFSVSVDGFKELNTYIRWPIDWKKWHHNVDRLFTLNKIFNFNTVVSLYNIGYLYDLYKFLEDHYEDLPCNPTLLEHPAIQQCWLHTNIDFVIADIDKIKTLKKFNTNYQFQQFFLSLEQKIKLNQCQPEQLKRFFKFNDLLDKSRNVHLRDYNPELDKLRERC